MNQIDLDKIIENVRQGDEAAVFILNLVCKSAIRNEVKKNPKPLPAPIQSFNCLDVDSLDLWERWTE